MLQSLSASSLDLAGRPVAAHRFATLGNLAVNNLRLGGLDLSAGSPSTEPIDQIANNAPDSGLSEAQYYTSDAAYDDYGRAHKVTNAVGTITKTEYDGAGRPKETWVGTSDANLRIVESIFYDGDTDHTLAAGDVGDGNVTRTIAHPSGEAAGTPAHPNRVTDHTYDWRNRPIITRHLAGVSGDYGAVASAPAQYVEYDNLDQPYVQYQVDALLDELGGWDHGNGVPTGEDDDLLRGLMWTFFDDRGRVYESQVWSVEPQYDSAGNITGATLPGGGEYLATQMWYDHRNNLIKQRAPGGLVTKAEYDGAGRAVKQYLTDGGGDTGDAHAATVDGDKVVEQVETTYDANGNPIFIVTSQRRHDAGGATGALGAGTARISYVANWFDRLNRVKSTVNFGTYGGAHPGNPANPTDPRPPLPPRTNADGWDEYLITDYAYNPAGHLELITDPRGIKTKREYDALGRVTKLIEAYTNGVVSLSSNRTVEYEYTGSDQVALQFQHLVGGSFSHTEYHYGVGTSDGSGLVNSNDLLNEFRLPVLPGQTGIYSTIAHYSYNALGETIAKRTDGYPQGNPVEQHTHYYTFDGVGRQVKDSVRDGSNNLHLHSSYDATIDTLTVTYDSFGRAAKFTSIGGGAIRNEVARQYNGFGQITEEWQRHYGDANPTNSLQVQYTYSGANEGSRLTSIIYPSIEAASGRTVTYNYGTAGSLDDMIGRVTSLSDSVVNDVVESYQYLGLSSLVEMNRPEPNVTLSYIDHNWVTDALRLDGNADSGASDLYKGLDRFGRVVNQVWWLGGQSKPADHFQYAYDGDSNRLYKRNMAAPWLEGFSELYSQNGSSTSGYDLLNRLRVQQVGKLKQPETGKRYSAVDGDDRKWQTLWHLNEQGQLTKISRQIGQSAWRTIYQKSSSGGQYDGSGNLSGTTSNGKPKRTYDGWNRLVQSLETKKVRKRVNDDTIDWHETVFRETYAYDALGRMITEKWSSGYESYTRDFYHTADWQTILERTQTRDYTGALVATEYRNNVWSLGYVDAMVFQAMRPSGDTGADVDRTYPIFDASFNVTGLLKRNGSGVWEVSHRFIYDAYGTAFLLKKGTDGVGRLTPVDQAGLTWSYLFHGGYHSAGAGRDGLYHFRRRSYDPLVGQWLQRDPAGFIDGLNLYEYLGSNPVNRVDPTGEFIWFIPLAVAAIGVGGIGYYTAEGAYYGGADGAGEVLSGAGYGARGGASIALNTFTFGGSDALGLTDSQQYQGAEFTASRVFATISREAAIMALTVGAAQIGRGGIHGAGWVARVMRSASYKPGIVRGAQLFSRGMAITDVATGSYQVGLGLGIGLFEGDWKRGGLHILGGALRAGGGFFSVREMSFWRAPAMARGRAIEAALGGNLPYGFKTIDQFVPATGVVTSIKSTADVAGQLSKMRGYIRQLASFRFDQVNRTFTAATIQQRQFLLAIPRAPLTQAQRQAIANLDNLAQQLGVSFVLRRLR